jgi:hypothetical protein
MIGSPAWRGAASLVGAGRTFASLVGAGRACLAAASAVNGATAAVAASVTMAGPTQRRVATVDCAVMDRFTMPCPVPVGACLDQIGDQLI